MKLQVIVRSTTKKSEAKKLRREGFVPAVLYGKGADGENIAIKGSEFSSLLRKIESGRLPTTIFVLVDSHGKERRAIVKDIQYTVTTYEVIHLDFEELVDDIKVNVKVPIECTGVVDCIGVKLGGVLRQVIRHVKVRCFPKDIPTSFKLDVKDLAQRQSRRLSDVTIPTTVRPLVNLNEVAVLIAKR